ncbi:MAG: histidine--tRNA ligase [Flavobacteriaceae bacterium]
MAQKPSIPKGTRDFSPAEIAKRDYIIDVIRKQFERFGFLPIETPAMENLETLTGKYGDEGDRLIFKILNSGDYLAKIDAEILAKKDANKLAPQISQKALRYDLTVPFARYVVMHQNEIDFPFKRYQIQAVWRADRPQKGRFREFFQCDADVVGSDSLIQELEFIQLYDAVFKDLGFNGISIRLNHRKILSGLAEILGAGDKIIDFTTALDKMDKIGFDGVMAELKERGFPESTLTEIAPLFSLQGSNKELITSLRNVLQDSSEGREGIDAVEFLLESSVQLGLDSCAVRLDIALARGLNYYTGPIFEIQAPEGVKMGSIGGGGRYDDLTGIFGLKGVSGVGISFGLDRIYLVMEELGLFPESVTRDLEVFFLNFGEAEAMEAMKLLKAMRKASVKCDIYPNSAKIQKQMKYANNRGANYVVSIGENELKAGEFQVKNMKSGEQTRYPLGQADIFIGLL